jgi:RNA polymerase sigma-70 factor (ECF subfamily)
MITATISPRIAMDEPPVHPPRNLQPEFADAESSHALVARAQAGDDVALEALCARYLPRLQRWAHGRLPAWARGALDTQDLVQDTLTQVIRRLDAFTPRHDGAFQAYLRQALLNRIRDEMRRAQRNPAGDPLDSSKPATMASPLEEAIGAEALARYERALERLKEDDRDVIILRVELGLSHA